MPVRSMAWMDVEASSGEADEGACMDVCPVGVSRGWIFVRSLQVVDLADRADPCWQQILLDLASEMQRPGKRNGVAGVRRGVAKVVGECRPVFGPIAVLQSGDEQFDELGIPHLSLRFRGSRLASILLRDDLRHAHQRT